MKWYPRSFEALEAGDVVEFYPVGVDPNHDEQASPWHGRPVMIYTAPAQPGGDNGTPEGLMVHAGHNGDRVRDDEYAAWAADAGYSGVRLG